MNIVTEIDDWKKQRKLLHGKSVGFIPTMGNLHAGHLSLCKRSLSENDVTVVSIFVNPTQFNNKNDLVNYPRTLSQDIELLKKHNVDIVFCPGETSLYPDKYEIQVSETDLSKELEGEYRPGHFNGMLTIVLKLFNLIQPKRAYFGEKDYQQLFLVKKMVSALFIPVDIIACKTLRNDDGLALSSRNSRLSEEQKKLAAKFPKLLHSQLSNEDIAHELTKLGSKVDYITHKWERRLGAVYLNDVRLIDNINISSKV